MFDSGPNTILKESYNSLQSKKAILFLKGGNATTDNSLQVTIGDYTYELGEKEVGNIFTTDSDHNKTNLDSSSINFKWITNDSLVIDFDSSLRTFIQKDRVEDVYIMYIRR
jgi:hypothetical protein